MKLMTLDNRAMRRRRRALMGLTVVSASILGGLWTTKHRQSKNLPSGWFILSAITAPSAIFIRGFATLGLLTEMH